MVTGTISTQDRAGGHPPPPGVVVRGGLLLLLVAGCNAGEAASPPPLAELPILVEVPTPTGQPGLSTRSAIALGPDGAWLFASPDQTDAAVVLVSDATPSGLPIGGIGEGPGEARMAYPLIVDTASVSVFDLAAARFTTWRRDGELVSSRWLAPSVIPMAVMADGRLLGGRGSSEGRLPVIIDPSTGKTTEPLEASDTLYRELFQGRMPNEATLLGAPAVLGSWAGGVVVGDGEQFTFGLFDEAGRRAAVVRLDLPPRYLQGAALERELDRLQSAGLVRRDEAARATAHRRLAEHRLPWVSHLSPPRSDVSGRLWILRHGGADSVVAEVFAGEQHLGSLPLSCPDFGGEWALSRGWLALVCGPADPASDLDAVVRRYRVEDRARQLSLN